MKNDINENKALSQTSVMVSVFYKDYLIDEDKTGYAPKEMRFSFFLGGGEKYCGSGKSIEDCKQQIDKL